MERLALMLAASCFVPLIMLIFGIVLTVKPPKSVNGIYGYRTARSQKSQEAWDYAQRLTGKWWTWTGAALLLVTITAITISYFLFYEQFENVSATATTLNVALLILTIIPVEYSLKKNFDETGNKK